MATDLVLQFGTWNTVATAEGALYFHNWSTQESRWTEPVEVTLAIEMARSARPPSLVVWQSIINFDSRVYYRNVVTQAVSWKCPNEPDQVEVERLQKTFAQAELSLWKVRFFSRRSIRFDL